MNKSKVLITCVSVFIVVMLVAGAASGGFLLGRAFPSGTNSQSLLPALSPSGSNSATTNQELFTPFWQAWDLIHKEYVDQPVNDQTLMQGAIKGMLDSLGDKHTSYMNPTEYKDMSSMLQGEYEGIGAWVNTDGDFLTISQPMPGSPAEKAGLKPGDKIFAIDGQDMTGIAPEVARQHVLGKAGTTVKLTINRDGEPNPLEISVVRGTITVPSVTGKMLDNQIAYVQIFTFGDKTDQELQTTLTDLMAKKPAGLILDLRNNGGGELRMAIRVASQFIGSGVIMYEAYGNGQRDTYDAIKGGLATDIPLVVLVNQYTASASEIVAGAIQDYGRGQLVGVVTYGKGTVQNWSPLPNEAGAVKITIARWLTPKERNIHGVGLTPEVVLERTDADLKANLDPQLDKAVELLTKK